MWPGIDARWRNLANHTALRWSRHSARVLWCLCVHRARNTTLRQILPRLCHKCVVAQTQKVTAVGFEPTPFRSGALSHRLRPLGQTVMTGNASRSHSICCHCHVFKTTKTSCAPPVHHPPGQSQALTAAPGGRPAPRGKFATSTPLVRHQVHGSIMAERILVRAPASVV